MIKKESYKIFTIESGEVSEGAIVEQMRLQGAGVDIDVILVGEKGRGRELAVIPVIDAPIVSCPDQNVVVKWASANICPKCGVKCERLSEEEILHPLEGWITGKLMFAEIGQTRAGKPKFLAKDMATTEDAIICVFRTRIGYRGGNAHTGDRVGWKCSCGATGEDICPPAECPECGKTGWGQPVPVFAEFPGKVLARGIIAQGAAGRMGSGEQIIAMMPRDVVFRTAYSGRLYGKPGSHYYKFDGKRILSATWEERLLAEIF